MVQFNSGLMVCWYVWTGSINLGGTATAKERISYPIAFNHSYTTCISSGNNQVHVSGAERTETGVEIRFKNIQQSTSTTATRVDVVVFGS